ncbi:hypothetical protein PRIPAC_78282 [Pristionchus pacificus]|uniref:Uncharacterized protein n=1 Tax=Pristionchus pacificus TaxID=54126 RepID=A0A2A6CQW2_PRIPA|nr:hypothetical protein PRIPAC_78282 [Pristionchus pacificus]|eukprot:PDM80433.1 hypothetical protein PRIPAC_33012 [Pristionchus pacificus]
MLRSSPLPEFVQVYSNYVSIGDVKTTEFLGKCIGSEIKWISFENIISTECASVSVKKAWNCSFAFIRRESYVIQVKIFMLSKETEEQLAGDFPRNFVFEALEEEIED